MTGDYRLVSEGPGRLQGLPEAKAAARTAWPRLVEQVKDALVEENERNFRESGFDRRVKDNAGMQEQLKKGLRIEGVEYLPGDRAWALKVGRNADGSEYRFSELFEKKGEAWLWLPGPPTRALASLPEGWPPPGSADERPLLQAQLTLMVMLIPELHSTIEEALRDALKKAKHPLGTH